MRIYSSDVPAGPFHVANLSVISGGGEATVVLRDSLGRETTASLSLYSSNMLFPKGLLDFSVEFGLPRRNLGIGSNDYDDRGVMGVATARYSVTDWLTLKAILKAGKDFSVAALALHFRSGPIGRRHWPLPAAAIEGEFLTRPWK